MSDAAFQSGEPDQCLKYSDEELLAIADRFSDDPASESLTEHLESCSDCRRRVGRIMRDGLPEYAARLSEIRRIVDVPDSVGFASKVHASHQFRQRYVVGERIGRYEVITLLGQGGSSTVYECLDRDLGRRVAVKVLAEPRFDVQRINREAAILAKLDHPGIVRVFEIDYRHDPPFIVMELVRGGSSKRLLANGPIASRQAAELAEGVARALHYTHGHGIVHRDIKPSNLLIPADSGDSRAIPEINELKIADFGLARALEIEPELTLTGTVIGTPAYMSPEQTSGRSGSVGIASDIYSLGCVLYEFLVGKPPLESDNVAQSLRMIEEVEPLPPRMLNEGIPVDLETICLKCLQKAPAARYGTALELADDLRRFAEGRPVLARPIGRPEKFWRWCRRNPGLAAALAGVMALVLSIMGLAVAFAMLQRDLRSQAEASAEDYRLAALHARRSGDLARNMAISGIRARLHTIAELKKTDKDPARIAILEKARAECDETVRQYVTLAKRSGVMDADMAEAMFRDAMALRSIDHTELADSMLDTILAHGRNWQPDQADYARIRRVTIRSVITRAMFLRVGGQPEQAARILTGILEIYPFDAKYEDKNRNEVRDQVALLDNIIACYRDFREPPDLGDWLARRKKLVEDNGVESLFPENMPGAIDPRKPADRTGAAN